MGTQEDDASGSIEHTNTGGKSIIPSGSVDTDLEVPIDSEALTSGIDHSFFDKVHHMIGNEATASWYGVGREWLIEWMSMELRDYDRRQVEVIADLHLDPCNYCLSVLRIMTRSKRQSNGGITSASVRIACF